MTKQDEKLVARVIRLTALYMIAAFVVLYGPGLLAMAGMEGLRGFARNWAANAHIPIYALALGGLLTHLYFRR